MQIKVIPLKASEIFETVATKKSYKQCIYKAVIQYM